MTTTRVVDRVFDGWSTALKYAARCKKLIAEHGVDMEICCERLRCDTTTQELLLIRERLHCHHGKMTISFFFCSDAGTDPGTLAVSTGMAVTDDQKQMTVCWSNDASLSPGWYVRAPTRLMDWTEQLRSIKYEVNNAHGETNEEAAFACMTNMLKWFTAQSKIQLSPS